MTMMLFVQSMILFLNYRSWHVNVFVRMEKNIVNDEIE